MSAPKCPDCKRPKFAPGDEMIMPGALCLGDPECVLYRLTSALMGNEVLRAQLAAERALSDALATTGTALRRGAALCILHVATCAECKGTRTGDATMNMSACSDGAGLLTRYNEERERFASALAAYDKHRAARAKESNQ